LRLFSVKLTFLKEGQKCGRV